MIGANGCFSTNEGADFLAQGPASPCVGPLPNLFSSEPEGNLVSPSPFCVRPSRAVRTDERGSRYETGGHRGRATPLLTGPKSWRVWIQGDFVTSRRIGELRGPFRLPGVVDLSEGALIACRHSFNHPRRRFPPLTQKAHHGGNEVPAPSDRVARWCTRFSQGVHHRPGSDSGQTCR
jgi:hypothetical protein